MEYKIKFDTYNTPRRNQNYMWDTKQELYSLSVSFSGKYSSCKGD